MTDDCIFCRIAAGAVPSYRVYESEHVVAFMDVRPIRPGHVLVVPRSHYRYYDDMPAGVAGEVMTVAQRLAPRLRSLYGVERVALFFTGVDVAHAHAHVVPMHELTDVTSARYIAEERITVRPAPMAAAADLQESSAQIRSLLQGGDAPPSAV